MAYKVVQSGNASSQQNFANSIRQFAEFMKNELGICNIAKAEQENMQAYIDHLKERVDDCEIKHSTAANHISNVNTMYKFFDRHDLTIKASEHDLSRGARYNNIDKSISEKTHEKFKEYLKNRYEETGDDRLRALERQVELQRFGGLRMKEASLHDGKGLRHNNDSTISKGTKGGLERTFQSSPEFKEAVKAAREFIRETATHSKSLIPDDHTFKEWRNFAYKEAQYFKDLTGERYNYHGNRHNYANNRYEQITGVKSPIRSGIHGNDHIRHIADEKGVSYREAQQINKMARLEVSRELGHGRAEVTNSYLGR